MFCNAMFVMCCNALELQRPGSCWRGPQCNRSCLAGKNADYVGPTEYQLFEWTDIVGTLIVSINDVAQPNLLYHQPGSPSSTIIQQNPNPNFVKVSINFQPKWKNEQPDWKALKRIRLWNVFTTASSLCGKLCKCRSPQLRQFLPRAKLQTVKLVQWLAWWWFMAE